MTLPAGRLVALNVDFSENLAGLANAQTSLLVANKDIVIPLSIKV